VLALAQKVSKKELYPDQAQISNNDFFVTVSYKNKLTIKSQLIGDFNFTNIACALKIGEYFGVSDEQAVAAIESYLPQNNRSQVVQKGDIRFILDAYNANPSSMELSVRNFAQIKASKKAVLLGDMFEMGDYSVGEHQKMIALVTSLNFDQALFCGEEFYKQKTDKGLYFKTRDELKQWFDTFNFEGYTLLLKGSRGMALEKLVL
jgi:UDP-N-acetylmuramoyl-tripeptide--D-alanyl-D-alanine ligase